jgi:hypothetical protein
MSTIIASHAVPGTPISITIIHQPWLDRFPFIVLRETNGASFPCGPSRLSNGEATETEARATANRSWLHYIKCRDEARAAALPDPFDIATVVTPPPVQYPTVDTKAVPASNYALENERGDVEFYRVDVPSKGKWEGFRFVERLYGAPGTWREVKLRGSAGIAVLARILEDTYTDETRGPLTGPVAAALRFSRTFTRCAACSSPLSDPASIAEGLGPVCATRF